MRVLKHLLLAAAVALPVAATGQNAVPPNMKSRLPAATVPQGGQVRVDETALLKAEIVRLQRHVEALRQELQHMSLALETFKREYATHDHGLEGNAVPIDMFAGSAAGRFRGMSVTVSGGLPKTTVPRASTRSR